MNEDSSKNKKVSQELYDLDNQFIKATTEGKKFLKIETDKVNKEVQVSKGWTVKNIKYIEITSNSKVEKEKTEIEISELSTHKTESIKVI